MFRNILIALTVLAVLLLVTPGAALLTIHAQGQTNAPAAADNSSSVIFGLFGLLGLLVYVVEKVSHQRTLAVLTDALTAARNDKALIDEIHNAAINVVPTATLHKTLDTINTLAGVAKAYLPPDVDQAIDQGTGLARDIVNDDSTTTAATAGTTASPSLQTQLSQQ